MKLPKPGELACDGCGALAQDANFGAISWCCRFWCPNQVKIYGAAALLGMASKTWFWRWRSDGKLFRVS